MQKKKKHSPANMILGVIGGIAYIALLFLFGYQTWEFVSWLFPDDQMLMKLLTLISFDVCALLFGCIHLFYHFAHRAAKTWIFVGWIFTNILSTLASVFFLVIESIFRFHLPINQTTVDIGYAISIVALIFDGLMLTLWVYLEWEARHPRQDEFADEDESATQFAQTTPMSSTRKCDSCGKGGPGAFDGSVWFCQDCLQKVAENRSKPYMTTEDLERLFHEWQMKQQPQSPLAQPHVPTGSHEGNQNGK